MLCTSLNFKTHVPDFDPASCRLESTMLFFRNNIIVLTAPVLCKLFTLSYPHCVEL